jgi:pyrroloquinoline quinone biosynthesis protein E
MQILYVLPDYFEETPKPCYAGWGRHYLVVMPDGRTLPCHGATHITTLEFDSVRDRSLRWIWEESRAFRAFRGDEWMKEPCRSCARRDVDFGGCRCQAFALTGDAANADPVCTLTAHRRIIDAAIADAGAAGEEFRYRYLDVEPVKRSASSVDAR